MLSEYQGGLRLLETATGKVLRDNKRRVRNLPIQATYEKSRSTTY